MRRHALPLLMLSAIGGLLSGCTIAHRVSEAVNPESIGLGGRCADIIKAAIPNADIRIDSSTAADMDIRTMVAHVAGTRRDLKEPAPVAAECDFTDGILTGFRWTAGGPAP